MAFPKTVAPPEVRLKFPVAVIAPKLMAPVSTKVTTPPLLMTTVPKSFAKVFKVIGLLEPAVRVVVPVTTMLPEVCTIDPPLEIPADATADVTPMLALRVTAPVPTLLIVKTPPFNPMVSPMVTDEVLTTVLSPPLAKPAFRISPRVPVVEEIAPPA